MTHEGGDGANSLLCILEEAWWSELQYLRSFLSVWCQWLLRACCRGAMRQYQTLVAVCESLFVLGTWCSSVAGRAVKLLCIAAEAQFRYKGITRRRLAWCYCEPPHSA